MNESVRGLMKGKTEDEIFKVISKLPPNEMLKKSCQMNYLDGVKLALNNGADPSIDNNDAIVETSLRGYIDIVKLLLNDPRVNPSWDHNLAIECASENGYVDVVKLLLQDKRVKDKLPIEDVKFYEKQVSELNESVRDLMKGKTDGEIFKVVSMLPPNEMLKKSCELNCIDGIKLAIEKGADSTIDDNYLIKWASKKGYFDIVELLLQDPRVDPSVDRNYAIKNASAEGHIEIVKILLQDPRVDPSYDKNWTMYVACYAGYIEIVKLLLQDPRVDPSDINNVAIKYAFKKNRMNIVQLLLQDKRVREKLTDEEIEKYENKISGLNESVRDLMKSRSDKDILKKLSRLNPKNLFHKSCEIGYLNGVKIALERGADPSIYKNWAIRYASIKNDLELAKLLLQDPRVNPSDDKNYALGISSQKGHIEIVKLLLQDHRIDLSHNIDWVISWAFYYRRLDVVELLLQDKRIRSKLTKEQIKKYEN